MYLFKLLWSVLNIKEKTAKKKDVAAWIWDLLKSKQEPDISVVPDMSLEPHRE